MSPPPPGLGRRGGSHQGARYYRLPRRRRAWLAMLGWGIWGLVGLATALVGGAYIFLDDTLSAAAPNTAEARAARDATTPVQPGQPINVLLIGSDARSAEGGLSDTLILVRLDSQRRFISMLSLQRDLYVPVAGIGETKLNNAFATGGTALAIETVRSLTGQDVNYYLEVDFEGFESLVNEVDGVYIDVDRRYFNDNSGCAPGTGSCFEIIDLDAGYQRLNGADALDYVRYRHTDDDTVRIARQQQFLSDLKRQTGRLDNLTNIISFRRIFADNIETDISNPQVFLRVFELALRLPDNKIVRVQPEVSGRMVGEADVLFATDAAIADAVDAWRNPVFPELDEPEPAIRPAATDTLVLNGNGRAMGAEALSDLLRTEGFATRNGGNADTFDYAASVVRYAPDALPAGRRVQDLLGPDTTLEPLAPGAAGGADLVVVAGAAFDGTFFEPPPPPPAPPPSTIDTLSVAQLPRLRAAQKLGLRTMAPLKVAAGSRLRRADVYHVDETGGGRAPAVKLVFDVNGAAGRKAYWGIMMTTMEDPPILEGHTGVIRSGGREYLTYYDGRNLQRLAFQVDGVTYWISNTLDYQLSARTIEEIAKSMRPLNRATLPQDREPTPIEVEVDAVTE